MIDVIYVFLLINTVALGFVFGRLSRLQCHQRATDLQLNSLARKIEEA